MELVRHEDAAAFLERAGAFLTAREAEHNLMLGIAASLRDGPAPEFAPYLVTVERDGRVVAAGLRTPPRQAIVSHVDDPGAVGLLADDLLATAPDLPGVLGTETIARAFVELWRAATGQPARVWMALRMYQVERVRTPTGVPGGPRVAGPADRELVLTWFEAFHEAIGEPGGPPAIDRFFSASTSGLWLWEDGRPVSMAGYGGPTPHGIRIVAVYTPPERRRQGYARANVAALSAHLLATGRRSCFLFADRANATANRIYQAIGYQPVADVEVWRFGEA